MFFVILEITFLSLGLLVISSSVFDSLRLCSITSNSSTLSEETASSLQIFWTFKSLEVSILGVSSKFKLFDEIGTIVDRTSSATILSDTTRINHFYSSTAQSPHKHKMKILTKILAAKISKYSKHSILRKFLISIF